MTLEVKGANATRARTHVVVRSGIAVVVMSIAAVAAGLAPRLFVQPTATDRSRLEQLPANVWVELETAGAAIPRFRTDHGGAVYDGARNSMILFGSDTHSRNFDNSLLELDIDELRWRRPYARSPAFTLRTNAQGVRVAGARGDMPWPMHVYDSMVFDPLASEVIVLSAPKHSFVAAVGDQLDPVWAYSPTRNDWRVLGSAAETPNFFSAGAVYDSTREVVIAYAPLDGAVPFVPLAGEDEVPRSGIWEFSPAHERWYRVSDEAHHWGWFNAEFDEANRVMLVFGGHLDDPAIWAYRVGSRAGEGGDWERRVPGGDACPGGYYFPAAYDSRHGVTLLMPHDTESGRAVTCVYDYGRNEMVRLRGAVLPTDTILNYTMVYAEQSDVFVLVTGSFTRNEATRVWALRLDPTEWDE